VDNRQAEDGHHRIPNELLDRALVAADLLAGNIKEAGQLRSHLFRIGSA
jgi:hypothetical protein